MPRGFRVGVTGGDLSSEPVGSPGGQPLVAMDLASIRRATVAGREPRPGVPKGVEWRRHTSGYVVPPRARRLTRSVATSVMPILARGCAGHALKKACPVCSTATAALSTQLVPICPEPCPAAMRTPRSDRSRGRPAKVFVGRPTPRHGLVERTGGTPWPCRTGRRAPEGPAASGRSRWPSRR